MILDAAHRGRVCVQALDGAGAQGFIADELAAHLAAATGVAQPAPERIGGLGAARPPALVLAIDPALGREAHACAVADGLLCIRGGDARGLYHGVLAFLEQLGFRWYAPGVAGTVIPRLGQVEVPDGWRAAGSPAIPWRGFHICGTGWTRAGERVGHFDYETALWMARNRMNFKPIHNDEADEVAPWLDELMLQPLAFGHSYSGWLSPDLHAARPDFFPLIAGKRQTSGQCCVSNPEVAALFLSRIRTFADAHPGLPILSIAPNDGYKFCQCPACLALDTPADRARGEINRRQHRFAANLARETAKTHPHLRLSSIAYCNYLDPAEDVPREANLAVSICITRAQNRPLDDPDSPSNRTVRERLGRWIEKAGAVFWSSYDLSYGGTFPRPYGRQLVQTLRVLARAGVQGIKTEVTPGRYDRWQSAVFYLYLVARAAYDPETDPEALCDDFCRRYHGPAADACRRYYRINDEAIARFAGELSALDAALIPRVYDEADVARLQAAVREAGAALDDADPVYAQRLEPLQRQAEEIAAARRAVLESEAEAAPLTAPHLDQVPDFDRFDRLTWIEQRMRSNRLPYPAPGRFAVAWTDAALVVCFRMEEPDLAKALACDRLKSGVWGHSLVDCFFAPKPETGVYFQVVANLLGETYAARCKGREWDGDYAVAPRVRVRHGASCWEMILELPFVRMGMATPAAGSRMRLAVNRGQQCQSPSVLGGWPRGGSWHKVEEMGELIFG